MQRLRSYGCCCCCWLLLSSRRQRQSSINPPAPLKMLLWSWWARNQLFLAQSPHSVYDLPSPPFNPDLHSVHAHPVRVPAWHSGCLPGWAGSRSTKASVSCLIVTVRGKSCTDAVCWEELWWKMCVMTAWCCRAKQTFTRGWKFISSPLTYCCVAQGIELIMPLTSKAYFIHFITLFEDPRIT